MKKNKILSLILALAMAFSLAVPALATNGTINYTGDEDTAVEIEGILNDQIIKVTLESAPGAVLNPYGLGYSARTDYKVYDQVASKDNLIISQSNVPLTISVVASGSPSTGVELLDEWAGDETDRQIYMYAVFKALDTSEITDTAKDVTVAQALADTNKIYPKDKVTGKQLPIDYPTGNALVTEVDDNTPMANAIVIQELSGNSNEEPLPVAKLDATNTTATKSGNTTTYASKTIAAVSYKLCGNMVEEPEDGPWTSEDTVDISMEFTFSPAKADTRLQKIWAFGNFDIDLQRAYELNDANRVINVSASDFNLYALSNYETEYAYALSLRLPDKAKLDEAPTIGTSGKSGNIQEWHGGSPASSAWADITGNLTADVALYTAVDASPDGFITIKLEDLRAAAIGVANISKVRVPITLKCKLPTGTNGAMAENTYTINVDASIPPFAGTALTHAAKTDPATLDVSGMETALGVDSGQLSDVNLISVKGHITSMANIALQTDGSLSIAAANLNDSGGKDTYLTMELSYKDDGVAKTKSVDFKAPGAS